MNIILMIFLSAIGSLIVWRIFHIEKRQIANEMLLNAIHNLLSTGMIEAAIDPVKKPGANRKARTDEQKLAASERRKEWWAKKKASEAKANYRGFAETRFDQSFTKEN